MRDVIKPESELDSPQCHHLRKSTQRHNSVSDRPVRIKFVTSVMNHMPMTTEYSKSKLGVEFPYGVHLFSKCGSSSISAMD